MTIKSNLTFVCGMSTGLYLLPGDNEVSGKDFEELKKAKDFQVMAADKQFEYSEGKK